MTIAGLLQLFDELPAYQELSANLSERKTPTPLLLPNNVRAALLARLHVDLNVPILLLTGKVETAVAWQQALEMWLPEDGRLMRFPEPTPLPYERGPWSERTRIGRLEVLKELIAGQHPLIPQIEKQPLIVTSARAFLQKTIPTRRFITATRVLRVGQVIDLEKSQANWRDIGYEAVSVVEDAGQFSRRGGILDIFPVSSAFPVRIELFGDEIDTMRRFDPATQRSISEAGGGDLQQVVITPAREALPGVAQEYSAILEDESLPEANSLPSWRDDLADLRDGLVFPTLEFYLPQLFPHPASLLSYLPQNGLLVIDDWPALETAVRELADHADQIANEQPSLPPDYPDPLFDWQIMGAELDWWQPLVLGEGKDGEFPEGVDLALADSFEAGPRYGGQVRPLMTQLKQARRDGERVIVLSRQASRLSELWREELRGSTEEGLLPAAVVDYRPVDQIKTLPDPGSLSFVQGSLAEGFVLVRRSDNQILLDLLTDAEVFGWRRPTPRRLIQPRPSAPEATFADIRAGDYVVHLDFGIGRFEGLVTRNVGGNAREYLLVHYAGSDTVYVPVHHADRLGKWTGPDDRAPAVHRLGGKTWSKAKTRAKRAADELAEELLDLYAARETVSGHAFAADGAWQAELEASFPHQETEDQLRVIADVKEDMERAQPMDRLICGDVGYGKTEVALRAAFKAVLDSKQVAILVPTTILAQQHYTHFANGLRHFQ